MPKDTKTLGNNKARAWESLGFVHKKRLGQRFDTTSFHYISNILSSFLNVLNNPLTNLFCSILSPPSYLNFRSTYILIQRSIYCFTNQSSLFLAIKELK